MPALAALPLLGSGAILGGAAIAGGAQIAGGLIQSRAARKAAEQQSRAATSAAEIQAESGREEREFLERQAAEDKRRYEQDKIDAERRYEIDRRANYDLGAMDYGQSEADRRMGYAQGAARDSRLGSLQQMMGLGTRAATPAYIAGPSMPGYVSGADAGGGGYNGGNLDEARQKFEALFPDETLTPDMVKAKQAELEAAGFTLRPNAEGVVGKLSYGNGPIVDIIQGASSGLNRRQWLLPQGGPMGAAPGGYASPGVPVTLREMARRRAVAEAQVGPATSVSSASYVAPSQRPGYRLRDFGRGV